MRRTLLLLTFVLGLHSSGFSQTTTIVVVDFQEVFEKYTELRRLDSELRTEIEEFRNGQAEKLQALQQLNQEFNEIRKQVAGITSDTPEREALTQQATQLFERIKAEEQALQAENQKFNQETQAKAGRLRRNILKQVQEYVRKTAEQREWDLVLDSSAVGGNGLKVIPYADEALDETDEILRGLNQQVAEQDEAEASEEASEEAEPATTGE